MKKRLTAIASTLLIFTLLFSGFQGSSKAYATGSNPIIIVPGIMGTEL